MLFNVLRDSGGNFLCNAGGKIHCLVAVTLVASCAGRNACNNWPGKAASKILRPCLPETSGSISTTTLSKRGRPSLKLSRTRAEFWPSTHLLLPRTNTCSISYYQVEKIPSIESRIIIVGRTLEKEVRALNKSSCEP